MSNTDYLENAIAEADTKVQETLSELQQVINTAPEPVRQAVTLFAGACRLAINTRDGALAARKQALQAARSRTDEFIKLNDKLLKMNQHLIDDDMKQMPPGGNA
jgi:hypothetical protein